MRLSGGVFARGWVYLRTAAFTPSLGWQTEAHQNISRTANASCRSRQILKPACTNTRADVFGDAVQLSSFGKIGVDLAIPCGLIPLPDERSEFGELFGGKGIHSRFYFGKTHA